MDPTITAPVGADTTAETPAGPVKGSREAFLQKLGQKGIKSLGDFHPKAAEIRAKAAPPVPVTVEEPSGDAGVSLVRHDASGEVEKLRIELAELRGRLSATEKPAEVVEEKPDRMADPFMAAAVRDLGDGAPERFLNQAADLLEKRRLHGFNLGNPEKAEAAQKAIAQIDRLLDEVRFQAGQAREIAELKAELERRKNQSPDIAGQIEKLRASVFEGDHIAKHHPRVAHAMKSGALSREKVEARLGRISADKLEAWVDQADAVLFDLDDLYPDPPAPETTANPKTAPANPAATAPRAAGGQATKREPARTRQESRERFHERLRARG